jgi:AraC-like DNA-binding protein
MLSIPFRILNEPFVERLMEDGRSFVLRKTLQEPRLERPSYLARHAFSVVLAGEQRIVSEAGALLKLQAGHIGFIPRGMYTITDLLPEGGQFQSILFFYHQEVLDEFVQTGNEVSRRANRSEKPFFQLTYSPALQLFVNSLLQTIPLLGKVPPDLFANKLREFLLLLELGNPDFALKHKLRSLQPRQNTTLRQFLEQHYDKPLKVEDYAYLTGRSLSSFRRDFKRYFGQTPQRWLIERRMAKAYELLVKGQHAVNEIAFQVGYEYPSHFIKAFKKQYQQTPMELVRAANSQAI